MFNHIRYNSSTGKKIMVAGWLWIKYQCIRPVVSAVLFYCYYLFKYKKSEVSYQGQPLREGISVCIPCKNEGSQILLCLESLLGIADQFILVDNGSDDNTLQLLQSFKALHEKENVRIEIYSLPDAILSDLRQFTLSKVVNRWVLKWDSDMIAVKEPWSELKEKLRTVRRPTAFILPRLNLAGDLSHRNKYFPLIDKGEPFLQTFFRNSRYTEEAGRLEFAKIPIYFRMKAFRKKIFSIHLSEIRPPLRILYKTCYLDWREANNLYSSSGMKRYSTYSSFQNDWLIHNLQTNDESAAKFRAARLVAIRVEKCNAEQYITMPLALKKIIRGKKEQFEIIYKNGLPWILMDKNDPVLSSYQPTADDLSWIPDSRRFYDDEIRMGFIKSSN